MKVGTVALVGRPNTGKSTLINNLVGRKVTITSPRPQTTQFPIYAVMDVQKTGNNEDLRGQIIFIDTPGIFAKNRDKNRRSLNLAAEEVIDGGQIDVVLYLVDRTRPRGIEENRVFGTLRKVKKPKILVINKIDKREPDFSSQYKFLEDEFDRVVEISALKPLNLPTLLDAILELLPEGNRIIETESLPTPAFNMNATTFIEENIREKAFLVLRREIPYQIRVVADEITDRHNGVIYIRARILTTSTHYRKMIIGANASRIKIIGSMARKELEVATGKKIFLELSVEAE